MNHKRNVEIAIETINESKRCECVISKEVVYGDKRLYFKYPNLDYRYTHHISFDRWSEMYEYLMGFIKALDSISPF